MLENWLSTTSVLLGDVHYTFEPGTETIEVEAGPGILHDVGEARPIGYGYAGTEWTFRNGDTSFVVSDGCHPRTGPLPGRAALGVLRGAARPATAWRLERRARQVLLDLDVGLEGTPGAAGLVTIRGTGEAVSRLASAAMTATEAASPAGHPSLINPAPPGRATTCSATGCPTSVRCADAPVRSWDLWLEKLAG